ncbi:MAG TPA: AraC family transcriptional regulator [Candidatus Lachnoclostridium stercorigallinarum]|uniref:AraC family transcriptional regulator n=1 Tax=Candidatus Lachnoclostridium stercorigallinarum TaxID=2838634 RepID=A0A9D2GFJ2_9FIRM|nr:AraC family transcriptional regulator [Candidatus Lachnoclostridium stercorigallinarum]
MEKEILEVMGGGSEVVHYERPGLPLYIRTTELSRFEKGKAPCHWHDDVEWIHILKGAMNYSVNGRKVALKEGDSLMVNGRQMHYGWAEGKQDCRFICMLFHPSLLGGNELLVREYVLPVLENPELEYCYFNRDQSGGQETGNILRRAAELKREKRLDYEIETVGLIYLLWSRICSEKAVGTKAVSEGEKADLEAQKNMVSFICRYYGEPISLKDIAAAGHVSRSKCCRIFSRYANQSPVEFLNAYRLKAGREMLRRTQKSVTEIATDCGFNHLSYFSKQFRKCFGCTPREYRRLTEIYQKTDAFSDTVCYNQVRQ